MWCVFESGLMILLLDAGLKFQVQYLPEYELIMKEFWERERGRETENTLPASGLTLVAALSAPALEEWREGGAAASQGHLS